MRLFQPTLFFFFTSLSITFPSVSAQDPAATTATATETNSNQDLSLVLTSVSSANDGFASALRSIESSFAIAQATQSATTNNAAAAAPTQPSPAATAGSAGVTTSAAKKGSGGHRGANAASAPGAAPVAATAPAAATPAPDGATATTAAAGGEEVKPDGAVGHGAGSPSESAITEHGGSIPVPLVATLAAESIGSASGSSGGFSRTGGVTSTFSRVSTPTGTNEVLSAGSRNGVEVGGVVVMACLLVLGLGL